MTGMKPVSYLRALKRACYNFPNAGNVFSVNRGVYLPYPLRPSKGEMMRGNTSGKAIFSFTYMALCMGCGILCTGCGAREEESRLVVQEEESRPVVQEVENLSAVLPPAITWESERDAGTEGTAAESKTEGRDAPWDEGPNEGGDVPRDEQGMQNGDSACDRAEGEEAGTETPLLEQLFTYEIEYKAGWWGKYAVITGIAEEYEPHFWEYMEEIRDSYGSEWYLLIPGDINGVPVQEIAAGAFADRQMYGVLFPDSVELIGEEAFRNTGVKDIMLPANLENIGARAFEGCDLERAAFPNSAFTMEEKAFAGNRKLYSVLIPDVETVIGENVFEGCAPDLLICYGVGQEGKRSRVVTYAEENGFETLAVIIPDKPFIRYHEEPLVLKPEVRNFFYGDDAEDDLWCTWEEDEDAPNFGYSDWQWSGCSSWCGCIDFEAGADASSELASADGRYAADNVRHQSREAAWAEGADGPGIGESITCTQRCTFLPRNQWELFTPDNPEPVANTLYHYTEICIVNGYAKNQKTWEENGRVKRFAMYVEGKLYAYLELEDTILPQYFILPAADIIVPNAVSLEVRFVIEDVYPGTLYEDTCLTGLVMEFAGRSSH